MLRSIFAKPTGTYRRKKIRFHYFCLDMPHSDGCFVKSYSTEDTEAVLDSYLAAFAFLRGVPQSILYDNNRIVVATILGDGQHRRTQTFAQLLGGCPKRQRAVLRGQSDTISQGLGNDRAALMPLPVTRYDVTAPTPIRYRRNTAIRWC